VTRPARFAAGVAILLAIGGSGLAVSRGVHLDARIASLRSEVSGLESELSTLDARRESRAEPVSQSETGERHETRFRTWAHLIAALHDTSSWSRLTEVSYRTGPVRSPDTSDSGRHEMTATVAGRGSYSAIVEWVASLPLSQPPLTLDRLEITAEPGGEPRFEAQVSVKTALPLETPRLVALTLDRQDGEGQKP
jgi:uncharacterized small protein (DUF1192 family)